MKINEIKKKKAEGDGANIISHCGEIYQEYRAQ